VAEDKGGAVPWERCLPGGISRNRWHPDSDFFVNMLLCSALVVLLIDKPDSIHRYNKNNRDGYMTVFRHEIS
jgi:hypothetical protein